MNSLLVPTLSQGWFKASVSVIRLFVSTVNIFFTRSIAVSQRNIRSGYISKVMLTIFLKKTFKCKSILKRRFSQCRITTWFKLDKTISLLLIITCQISLMISPKLTRGYVLSKYLTIV